MTTVKERPMLMSAPMVRAILDGRKTMTRRVVKPQPPAETCSMVWRAPNDEARYYPLDANRQRVRDDLFVRCPYGQPGDRLWTREAWKTIPKYDHLQPREVPRTAPIWYLADGEAPFIVGRYRHGRFMMRWMSRGLDEITGVRVERLQDISEQDAIAEGVEGEDITINGVFQGRNWRDYQSRVDDPCEWYGNATYSFKSLWASINGDSSLALNPWVWVIEFKVLQ